MRPVQKLPDFLDGLDQELALADKSPKSDEHLAEVIEEARPEKERRLNEVDELQQRILFLHLRVVEDIGLAREVDITQDEEPPEEWVARMGEREARRSFNVARSAWLSQKEAPAFLKLSAAVVTGMLKAKATEKAGSRELMIGVQVFMTPPVLAGEEPMRLFPRKELEE
jgi:hypothetical protein